MRHAATPDWLTHCARQVLLITRSISVSGLTRILASSIETQSETSSRTFIPQPPIMRHTVTPDWLTHRIRQVLLITRSIRVSRLTLTLTSSIESQSETSSRTFIPHPPNHRWLSLPGDPNQRHP